jgi:hypothetical protein
MVSLFKGNVNSVYRSEQGSRHDSQGISPARVPTKPGRGLGEKPRTMRL